MRRALSWLAVLLIASGTAAAKKHPVPLEQNTSAAKCLECHEDKSKGKAVHSAVATGCLSCHELRVNRDITRVKLVTTTQIKLCLQCHSDKDAREIKGRVHSPAVRDCLKCHDPHVSDNKNQLLKPTTGASSKENLCLSCHNIGLKVPEKGSRHATLDSCDSCHVIHKSGDPAQLELKFHLAKNNPALCLDCHDAKSPDLAKAHQGQPLANASCLTCHDPHQSRSPKLMQKFVHAPFGDKQCDTCHKPAKDGKVVLTQPTKELCVTCHADKSEQIEKAKVQHPGAAGDCSDCHNPHSSSSPGMLKPDPVTVCLGCHSNQAEQHKNRTLHQPAFEQGCATCHEPHGGENKHLLRASNPNALCLECHGPDAKPEKLESAHLVTIFGGKVRLPEDYFRNVVRLPLKYGRGHPIDRHPVTNLQDGPEAKAINCLTCHQPHASKQPGLLAKDQLNNTAFCDGCHQNLGRSR